MSRARKLNSGGIETVRSRLDDSIDLASLVRKRFIAGRNDVTEARQILQFAVIGYSRGDLVGAHRHNPLPRQTIGTSECWIVMKGKIKVNLFDTDDICIFTAKLGKGDAAIFFSGGHSLEVVSRRAQIYELKNGPYEGSLRDRKQI